ncbi:MAG: prolipoprotein diacylglyceryl transferase family protein, partial [Patescibacteria group bacterium]
WYFSKKHNLNFWLISAILAPSLALAQAIGRWGNYFNQELFGLPTNLPWGIPINIINRPIEYISSEFFHPTFLYESLGNLLIFGLLIMFHAWIIKNHKFKNSYYFLPACAGRLFTSYLILYSILRFLIEFIRIDNTPEFIGLRWPQIASLVIIFVCTLVYTFVLIYKPKLIFSKTTDTINKS